MVDYSKFDCITDSSNDEADSATLKDRCHQGFRYPLNARSGLVAFDVRDETCDRFGYKHGDVVITPEGVVSTAIGVHRDRLWFHVEGATGAGLWDENETLKKVGHTRVEEGRQSAPSLKEDWLKLDFRYTAGLQTTTLAFFDTRDEICMKVGGFKHGDVVQPKHLPRAVTIGVKRQDSSGHLSLWFRVKGTGGAGIIAPSDLHGARVVGRQAVREHSDCAERKVSETVPNRTNRAGEDPVQLLQKKLATEQKARKIAEEQLEAAEKKLQKMEKNIERLRCSNKNLIKSTQNSQRRSERKDWVERDKVVQEVEAETKERLMNELSFQFQAQKQQLHHQLEINQQDTRRLREELARREAESVRLRSETEDLEQRISQADREKAQLREQLSSQAPASVEEEIWQFTSNDGSWESFPPRANEELQEQFSSGNEVCEVRIGGSRYEIDFKLMSQLNLDTSKRRNIRCFFGLPTHWEMTDDEAFRLLKGQFPEEEGSERSFVSAGTALTAMSEDAIVVSQSDFKKYAKRVTDLQTFRRLETLLNQSLRRHDGTQCQCLHGDSTYKIQEAYQVRNLFLWRRYQRFVRNMRDKQKQYGTVPQEIDPPVGEALTKLAKELQVDLARNERLLFHGTKSFMPAKAIVTEGFDNRVGKGGLYGTGTYFAAQTCKSAQYASRGGHHRKACHRKPGTMLVARVAVGDPYYATDGYSGSRAWDDDREVLCDSLIAKPGIQRVLGDTRRNINHNLK